MNNSFETDIKKYKVYHKDIYHIIYSVIKISFQFLIKEIKQDNIEYIKKVKFLLEKEEKIISKLYTIIKNK